MTAATANVAAPASAASERKTCKRFNATQSRLKSKRLCLTKAEWRDFEAAQ